MKKTGGNIIANVVAVDMGYGHQRAAYPLRHLSPAGVIDANNYPGIAAKEKIAWSRQSRLYNFISIFKKIPYLGGAVFEVMDYFQDIANFYPKRYQLKATMQHKFFFNKVKEGLGKNLIKQLNKNGRTLITTFPVMVYAADYWGFKNDLYCVICDADICRLWAPLKPDKSQAKYLVPTARAGQRLRMYGVRPANIIFTGFPLPQENIGGPEKTILKQDLANRLARLDTTGVLRRKYAPLLAGILPQARAGKKKLTVVFAIGGAGAQTEMAITLARSLKPLLKTKYNLTLVAGVNAEVKACFQRQLAELGLQRQVPILYEADKAAYFAKFNQLLRATDILFTKPSELSFYAGLGLPIVMTEPVGAQEVANRDWLLSVNAGLDGLDLRYANEWLADWLESGRLARAAFNGYYHAPSLGAYNIERIINH